MANHNDFGRAAEDAAARLLLGTGWNLLHRNWRFRRKEIDIIARKAGIVAFVEVRARRSDRYGHPLETIGWRKRRDLQAAARAWITVYGRPGDVYRFDAIAVAGHGGVPQHIEDAWRL